MSIWREGEVGLLYLSPDEMKEYGWIVRWHWHSPCDNRKLFLPTWVRLHSRMCFSYYGEGLWLLAAQTTQLSASDVLSGHVLLSRGASAVPERARFCATVSSGLARPSWQVFPVDFSVPGPLELLAASGGAGLTTATGCGSKWA